MTQDMPREIWVQKDKMTGCGLVLSGGFDNQDCLYTRHDIAEQLAKALEAVGKQCALMSFTTAGMPEKQNETKQYAIWAGAIQAALKQFREGL